MDAIKAISAAQTQPPISRTVKGDSGQGRTFLDTLKSFTGQVDQEINRANRKSEEFAVGKDYDLHEIMIATEKADLSFRLLLQIRNKLLDAYQEVMRMQF
ncbi:MAG: flagellar hook-basal body complex protein FliE [Thermodesulfobacteriota bacterium]